MQDFIRLEACLPLLIGRDWSSPGTAVYWSTYLQVLKCEPHAFPLEDVDQLVLNLGRVIGCPAIGRGAHPHRRLVYVRQLRLVGVFAEVDVAAVVALLADHLKSIHICKAVKQSVGSARALLFKFHAQCMVTTDQWSDTTFYQGRKIHFTDFILKLQILPNCFSTSAHFAAATSEI